MAKLARNVFASRLLFLAQVAGAYNGDGIYMPIRLINPQRVSLSWLYLPAGELLLRLCWEAHPLPNRYDRYTSEPAPKIRSRPTEGRYAFHSNINFSPRKRVPLPRLIIDRPPAVKVLEP